MNSNLVMTNPEPIICSDDEDGDRRRPLFILYGSQTGTGEDLAERVGREAYRRGYQPRLSTMNNCGFHMLPTYELICFIASTTGQGEEPNNMKEFWKFLLQRNMPNFWLSDTKFTVVGLGDSSYIKFNFVAKKLFKRLVQLGGTPVTELYLADDQHDFGLEATVDKWLPDFWQSINAKTPKSYSDVVLKPKFALAELQNHPLLSPIHPVKRCKLLKNERVTAQEHFQNTRLISIDLSSTDFTYNPGDVVMIQPSNSDENVETFFKVFSHLEPLRKEAFYIVPNLPWVKVSTEIERIFDLQLSVTLEELVRHCFDLQCIPTRFFFEVLCQFSDNEIEKEKLAEFSSTEGQQELYAYCIRPKRTALEVFLDFPNTTKNIPKDYLFDLMRPIKPRAFSIASSMKAQSKKLQILVAVVSFKTKLKKPRLGLCSNWLANLSPGDEIPIWIDPGSFHFPPPDKKQPVIMVGPGTGVAPFHSFISERESEGKAKDLILFFGCRYSQKDFYFADMFARLQAEHKLQLITAFSRENPNTSRVYVQHKIKEHGKEIWDLIENKCALIFVAGSAKQMPIEVSEAFISIFRENGCPHPELYMKNLVKSERYQKEVWS